MFSGCLCQLSLTSLDWAALCIKDRDNVKLVPLCICNVLFKLADTWGVLWYNKKIMTFTLVCYHRESLFIGMCLFLFKISNEITHIG